MKPINDFCKMFPEGIRTVVKTLIYAIAFPLALILGMCLRHLLVR